MTPALLAKLKIALGIPAGDTSKDAAITVKADSVLAMLRTRTGATLYPLRRFRDTFHGERWTPPSCAEGLTPKHQPVAEVEAIEINGAPVADLDDFPLTTDGRISVYKAPGALHSTVAVTYQAGFAELPDDLFEILAQILAQWLAAIEAGSASFMSPKKISLVDVGSIEFGGADTFTDILGPWGATLDAYANGGAFVVAGPLIVESVDLGPVATP